MEIRENEAKAAVQTYRILAHRLDQQSVYNKENAQPADDSDLVSCEFQLGLQ